MSDEFNEIKDEEKEKMGPADQPSQEQSAPESTPSRDNNSWIAGVAIIAVGVIFLLSNFTDFRLDNWWALFILIPGLITFANAWRARKEDGHWSKKARGSLIGGLAITMVAAIFLFNLDWGKVWPLFLILGGVAALLGGLFDS
jgi:hypothetical protein